MVDTSSEVYNSTIAINLMQSAQQKLLLDQNRTSINEDYIDDKPEYNIHSGTNETLSMHDTKLGSSSENTLSNSQKQKIIKSSFNEISVYDIEVNRDLNSGRCSAGYETIQYFTCPC